MRTFFHTNIWGQSVAFIAVCGLAQCAVAQTPLQTLRIATYNIAADVDGVTTPNPGTSQVLEGIGEENYQGIEQPLDIVALEETTSNDVTVAPIVSDLNTFYSGSAVYAQSTVQGSQSGGNADGNGPNAIIYNTKTLQLIQSVGIGRPRGATNGEYRQVMRYEFEPVGGTAATAFYVYVVHMKSSASGDLYTDESYRTDEAQIIRNNADTLVTAANPNPSILYMGDFNLSGTAKISNSDNSASVSAYQTLTAPGYAQALDPLNPTNNYNISWNGNPTYAPIMTEEATYLNYRDDLQLMSPNVLSGSPAGGLLYIPGSLHAFGNNGSIGVGGEVTDADNTALNDIDPNGPITAAQLETDLSTASDHFPVVADYTIPGSGTFAVPEPSALILAVIGVTLLTFRRTKIV